MALTEADVRDQIDLEEGRTSLKASPEEDVARTRSHVRDLSVITDDQLVRRLIHLYSGLYDARAERETCPSTAREGLDKRIQDLDGRVKANTILSRFDPRIRRTQALVEGIEASYVDKPHSHLSSIAATAHDLRIVAPPLRRIR